MTKRPYGIKPTTDADLNDAAPKKKSPGMPRFDSPRKRKAAAVAVAASTLGGIAAASSGGSQNSEGAPRDPESISVADTKAPATYQVRDEWDMEVTKNEQVDFFIEFLQWKNRDKTKVWLERLGHYGPMIQQKLAERGMPQDLIWLATIESGLDTNAYSKADAAGLWQFIEETGERYGLEVNEYVDERRDPEAATDAALDYLKMLHGRFGSWYLSAAGYNTGENRVQRIVREKAGSRFGDEKVFWEIEKHLPKETRDYVPVMLAMGHIGKDPHKYGFTDLKQQQPYSYDQMQVPGGTKLSDVAAQIGVDPEQVYELNRHLLKKMTPPDQEMQVRVPKGSSASYAGAAAPVDVAEPKGE